MATMPALDLATMLKGIPRGAWVAISEAKDRVIAYGSDLRVVIEDAKRKGEADPLITRVPESASTLIL
jgi:uncharacterized protein DUF5678